MTTWMIRAGEGERWLDQFIDNNLVAAGWAQIRKSTKEPLAGKTHQEIYDICAATFKGSGQTTGAHASQLFAFFNRIKGGDFVIVPSDSGKSISVGLIRSEAIEQPEISDSFVAIRNILWLTRKSPISALPNDLIAFLGSPKTVVKTKLSQKNVIDFVQSVVGINYWFHLMELGVQTWVFQSSPERWNPEPALKIGYSESWAINQGFKEIMCGDTIIFREGGANSGLYSIGHLTSDVRDVANEYGQRTASVAYDFEIVPRLSKAEVSADIDLQRIATITGQQFTNRKLEHSDAALILNYVIPRLQEVVPRPKSDVNYWWCNVGVTKTPAIATGKLWAHAASSNGRVLKHHTDVKQIQIGDIVLLYADKKIVAMGPCIEESIDATRPSEYPEKISSPEDDAGVAGFLVRGEFEEFDVPIAFEAVVEDLKNLVDDKGPLASNNAIKMGYLYPLSKEFGEKFMEDHGTTDKSVKDGVTQLPTAPGAANSSALAEQLHLTPEWVSEVLGLIEQSKQVIFYGPPGTGKTFVIKALANAITNPDNVQLIQFHPSFSYEDFFEGYRPKISADEKSMLFEKSPGPLRRMAEKALANPDEKFVLIIDEINRGNLAKVFGELYFLLEYREESVELMYSTGEKFKLPENLLLLGTMNTADKSIANLDSAIRRRFQFVSLIPTESPCDQILSKWLAKNGLPKTSSTILTKLNAKLADHNLAIGPAYFMKSKTQSDADLSKIWRYSILPLLEDHFYGQWDTRKSEFKLEDFK
ncbi:MAG: AAA family ATPase [Candidatus Planktophila sp.]|nr:AAA family ATPase [Candidatus Planktophila sp.]